MFRDLSLPFHKYHVGHFVKNIQKVFLVVFIGVPYIQTCGAFHGQFIKTIEDSEEKEDNVEATAGTEKDAEDSEEKTDEDMRRSSITTFFSFTSNELYNEGSASPEEHYNEAFSEKSPSLTRQIANNRSV